MCAKMRDTHGRMCINQANKLGSGITGSTKNGCGYLFHAGILRNQRASARKCLTEHQE
jgi:hypothetical protein